MTNPVRKFSTGGGLFNILDANVKYPVPQVGDGATLLHYSDREPATVISVAKVGKSTIVTVQDDKATRIDKNGISESQTYTFERDPSGSMHMFRLRKDGMWVHVYRDEETGRLRQNNGVNIRFGNRDKYYDPCF